MQINSLKIKKILITAILVFLGITPVLAEENIISSVVISKSKDKTSNYELSIDSTQAVQYKTHIEDDNSIYFDLKNSTLAPDLGTIYDDVSNINNVVVKQLDRNKVRIYVEGTNARNTELIFVNSLFETAQEPSKKIIINRPITEYKSTSYQSDLENQEDAQEWDDNSFNFSHLGTSLLSSLKEGISGMVLIILSLFAIMAIILKSLTTKLSQDREPLIGLNNSKYLDNNYQIGTKKAPKMLQNDDLESVSQRNQTLKAAQEELTKAHQKYQQYIQNKYKGNYKPKSVDIDAIKKGIALNQYQRSTQNPYLNQEVIKFKKEFTNNVKQNQTGEFKIPPRPKMETRREFSSPYIQRNKPIVGNNTKKEPQKANMRFLESVTKIYENSGRGDLADGLKNSISKAKQSI